MQFIVEHAHTDDTCPANSMEGVKMMGELVLGKNHADSCGVKLLNDYHVRGQHRLLLLIEAGALENAEDYAKPFKMVGKTDVLQLDRCTAVMQEVVARLTAQGNEDLLSSAYAARSTGCGSRSG